jgi:hypothetical protein
MKYYKYPRTFHLPDSPGATSDDKVLQSINHFVGHRVVVTEKMDGENTTIYMDNWHARSLDTGSHPSRSNIAALQAKIGYLLNEDERICGENLYAKHSIHYTNLAAHFLAFSFWIRETCLSWDDSKYLFSVLELNHVPELYIGEWDKDKIYNLAANVAARGGEGIVVRPTESFALDNFQMYVAKWVRKNHVTTDDHWLHNKLVINTLNKK